MLAARGNPHVSHDRGGEGGSGRSGWSEDGGGKGAGLLQEWVQKNVQTKPQQQEDWNGQVSSCLGKYEDNTGQIRLLGICYHICSWHFFSGASSTFRESRWRGCSEC